MLVDPMRGFWWSVKGARLAPAYAGPGSAGGGRFAAAGIKVACAGQCEPMRVVES
jgi:hypothetical protein